MERLHRAWDDYVVEYNLQQQTAILERVQQAVRGRDFDLFQRIPWKRLAAGAGFMLVGLALGYGVWRNLGRTRKTSRRAISALAKALDRALSCEQGAPVAEIQTFREVLQALESQNPCEKVRYETLWKAVELYEAERFADVSLNAQERRRIVRGLRRVQGSAQPRNPQT